MKLEIDIPSIIYNDAKENRCYISVDKMGIAWKAIANGKPQEQEPIIDKIRADISALQSHHINDCYDDGFQACRANVLQIIDKYKSEGEKENEIQR